MAEDLSFCTGNKSPLMLPTFLACRWRPLPFPFDAFRDGIRKQVNLAQSPVEWVVVDASPVNVIDATAVSKIDELREELQARGIRINFAGIRHDLLKFFKSAWTRKRYEAEGRFDFPNMAAAIEVFQEYGDNK